MIRKLVALVPFVAVVGAASHAGAIPLDPYGTSTPDPWDAPKVAPSTACRTLMLYAADATHGDDRTDKYRFTGECTFNVARKGLHPVWKTVDVLVDAEWNPKMKRASERIVAKHPELGVEFTTWATCDKDPFVEIQRPTIVNCKDKGMGAHKFSMFISVDDAPYAKQRATKGQVDAAVKAVGANKAKIWENPSISRVRPIGKVDRANGKTGVYIDVAGGAGLCPMELDFGDGTKKERFIVWGADPFVHYTEHQFAKPGALWVKAKALPGCNGEAQVVAIVK